MEKQEMAGAATTGNGKNRREKRIPRQVAANDSDNVSGEGESGVVSIPLHTDVRPGFPSLNGYGR